MYKGLHMILHATLMNILGLQHIFSKSVLVVKVGCNKQVLVTIRLACKFYFKFLAQVMRGKIVVQYL